MYGGTKTVKDSKVYQELPNVTEDRVYQVRHNGQGSANTCRTYLAGGHCYSGIVVLTYIPGTCYVVVSRWRGGHEGRRIPVGPFYCKITGEGENDMRVA